MATAARTSVPEAVGVKTIPTKKLHPNPHNPRMLFDKTPLDTLRKSIAKVGILVPLTVYWSEKQRIWVILDGQRRWMCAQDVGLKTVPVNQVAEPSLVQNIVTMFQIHKLREDWELMPTARAQTRVKKPRERGLALDDARFAAWLDCFAGYRSRISRAGIQRWTAQFTAVDQDLAARLLDAVEFYRPDMLADAYSSVLGRLPGWSKSAKARVGKWRFAPFTVRAGESGDMMLTVFRAATKLNTGRYDDLFLPKSDLLGEELGPDDSVVFVDDFAGTGNQALTAWEGSLHELLPGAPKTYLVLVAATQDAITRISAETPLKVATYRRLRSTDNFFSIDCKHFSVMEKQRVLHYCQQASAEHPRGYGDCGVVVVMAHRCPNNSLPILHSKTDAFRGLFPR